MTITFPPTKIGLETPGPGSGIFHAMLSVGVHETGNEAALAEFPLGPRNWGQSSAMQLGLAIHAHSMIALNLSNILIFLWYVDRKE